jgi:hypothetical protein
MRAITIIIPSAFPTTTTAAAITTTKSVAVIGWAEAAGQVRQCVCEGMHARGVGELEQSRGGLRLLKYIYLIMKARNSYRTSA